MKDLILSLMAIKVYPFEFGGKTLYCKDLTIKEADECNQCLELNEKNTKGFMKYRNKFLSFSLCDEDGKNILTSEDINKLSNSHITLLFEKVNKRIDEEIKKDDTK